MKINNKLNNRDVFFIIYLFLLDIWYLLLTNYFTRYIFIFKIFVKLFFRLITLTGVNPIKLLLVNWIFLLFCYYAWPFDGKCIIFLLHKHSSLTSKKSDKEEKQSLIGLTPGLNGSCYQIRIAATENECPAIMLGFCGSCIRYFPWVNFNNIFMSLFEIIYLRPQKRKIWQIFSDLFVKMINEWKEFSWQPCNLATLYVQKFGIHSWLAWYFKLSVWHISKFTLKMSCLIFITFSLVVQILVMFTLY